MVDRLDAIESRVSEAAKLKRENESGVSSTSVAGDCEIDSPGNKVGKASHGKKGVREGEKGRGKIYSAFLRARNIFRGCSAVFHATELYFSFISRNPLRDVFSLPAVYVFVIMISVESPDATILIRLIASCSESPDLESHARYFSQILYALTHPRYSLSLHFFIRRSDLSLEYLDYLV